MNNKDEQAIEELSEILNFLEEEKNISDFLQLICVVFMAVSDFPEKERFRELIDGAWDQYMKTDFYSLKVSDKTLCETILFYYNKCL